MECENCGTEIVGDADVCPECGEPTSAPDAADGEDLAAATEPAEEAEGADSAEHDVLPDDEGADIEPAEGETTDEAEPMAEAEENGKRPWLIPVIVGVIILAVLAAGGVYLFALGGLDSLTGNQPGPAALRMLQAFSTYDAQGILDNATHGNLGASGIADFKKTAADAKKRANGKPGVKDLKVLKVTPDPKDPSKATVDVQGSWLTDSAKGSYESRTEQLKLIKENGKWLVQLFV